MIIRWPLTAEYRKITTRFTPTVHWGIDISCPDRTPVYAAHAGVARYEWTELGGYCIRLTDGDTVTRYVHLGSYTVEDGERVVTGQELGRIGKTGSAWTGYHLHFELHIRNERVDPLVYLREGEAMSTRCLLRYQAQIPALPDAEVDYINAAGLEDVLIINPDWGINRDKALNCPAAVRFWFDNEPDKELVYQGAAGAERWLAMVKPRWATAVALGWRMNAVLGPNEVFIDTLEKVRALNAFSIRARQLVRQELGATFWAYCYSEGNPPYPELYKYHADSAAQMDVIALHEYRMGWQHAVPAEQDTWHMLRYRRMAAALGELGIPMPETRITEHGIDSPTGWRAYVSAAQQMAYILDYETACLKDAYVRAVYPFIWNNYPDQWQNFSNSGTDFNPLYFAHIRQHRGESATSEERILAVAQTHIIAQVPDFALYRYIKSKGWDLASGEFAIDKHVYQWGFDARRKVRVLCRTSAPSWKVEEFKTVAN
jgi:hypothetical protein